MMIKKTILAVVLIVSIGLNILFLIPHREHPSYRLEHDNRIAFQVKEEHREFVMNEMRLFVESLQLVNEGIEENNPEKIMKAAAQSGSAVNPPKELVASVPKGFLQMGRPTHKLFDIMADSAREDFNPNVARQQFTTQLNNCIACHKTYKMEVFKTEEPIWKRVFSRKGKNN